VRKLTLGGVFDDEERVEPVQGDRVEVEHVAGQDRLGLCSEELRPGRAGPSWPLSYLVTRHFLQLGPRSSLPPVKSRG
jgi:hypothetical protein